MDSLSSTGERVPRKYAQFVSDERRFIPHRHQVDAWADTNFIRRHQPLDTNLVSTRYVDTKLIPSASTWCLVVTNLMTKHRPLGINLVTGWSWSINFIPNEYQVDVCRHQLDCELMQMQILVRCCSVRSVGVDTSPQSVIFSWTRTRTKIIVPSFTRTRTRTKIFERTRIELERKLI